MQIDNVPLPVRLTIGRACQLALYMLVLAINPFIVPNETRAASIAFSEYPLGTAVTNQYQGLGVIFSGETSPPIISTPDYFGSSDASLTTGPSSNSIIVTFVDPNDGTPAVVGSFSIYFYALFGNSMKFTFYDINGDIISQQETGFSYNFKLISPPVVHKFTVVENNAWIWIANLSFQILPDHCADAIINSGEAGIDCGGGCPPCNFPVTPRDCSANVQ